MSLVKARLWIRDTFEPGSRPRMADVIEWIESDAIPGKIIAGEAYVDADRFAVQSPAPQPPARRSGVELLM